MGTRRYRVKYWLLLSVLIGKWTVASAASNDYRVVSPDGQVMITVSVDGRINWSITKGEELLLTRSPIDLVVDQDRHLGWAAKPKREETRSVDEELTAVVPLKQRTVPNRYNELELRFDKYVLQFRVYNDGAAYRFVTAFDGRMVVADEPITLNFPTDYRVFWSDEANPEFQSHFESLYTDSTVGAFGPEKHAALPLLVQSQSGTNLLISETDLYDYPNMFLFGTAGNALTAGYPKVILKSEKRGDRGIRITKTAPYIAETAGTRMFPWRTIAISDDDKGLLVNELNYKLASPPEITDTDWIKPGKVAWDWWNANNIYGVDFKAGINTETYKYYIDFAAKFGLEYIMLDEGWTRTTTDLLHAAPSIDIEEIIHYGASKGVGVWLWCLWGPLDENMDAILDQYAAWGAKGIKVDFMARADQYMVNFYERVARETAKRKLMVDLHGAYKPTGLHHRYPNVLSYEGVRGLENHKWENTITPRHNLTLPFTRMVAGPMDYTPGAMKNVVAANFYPAYTEPMSMGTRVHQVAMYVLYESPLQMLADNPSNYLADSACTAFIARIPTVWDETVALAGEVGEFAAIARRHGNTWYVGAMTDWDKRDLSLVLPFGEGKPFKITVLQDGINSDRHASDYRLQDVMWDGKSPLDISMASGGGWVGIFEAVMP